MGHIINSFFMDLFKSGGAKELEGVFEGWNSTISMEQRRNLKRTFQKVEVDEALLQMAPMKAPGPDGMPPRFFQQFWSEVGEDVTATVLKFLNLNGSMEEFNKTLICLIPKVKNAERIREFRPISLCNTVYKIAAKVLANRLTKVLPNLVAVN